MSSTFENRTAPGMVGAAGADATTWENAIARRLRGRVGRRRALRRGLRAKYLVERGDRDLDLRTVGRLRGDLLQPEPGRHQRPHRARAAEPRAEPEELVRHAGDDRDRDDARDDPPHDAGIAEEREDQDGE